ncbi:Methyltransferase type 12, partial [mine drainage metagenome]
MDLGTGPGPLAKRIVERFPRARVVLVDHDTSLLKVAEEALRPFGRRVRPVKLDYSKKGWERRPPLRRFHAVVTSLALHDLPRSQTPTLYRAVSSLLRPGGVFLNSDGVSWGRGKPGIGGLFDRVRKIQVERRYWAPREAFLRELEGWWRPLRRYAPLKQALERRDRVAKT